MFDPKVQAALAKFAATTVDSRFHAHFRENSSGGSDMVYYLERITQRKMDGKYELGGRKIIQIIPHIPPNPKRVLERHKKAKHRRWRG